jgi:cell division protein FtsL
MKKQHLENIKETGFKVPQNYFEEFEDSLISEIKLKETCVDSGFIVPTDYFNTVENDILNKVNESKKPKVIKLITWQKLSYATAVAASLLIMFSIIFNNSTVDINKIETASIETYILNEEFDTNDMATLFKDVDVSTISLSDNNINSETLENYLLDNLEIEELLLNNK